MLRTRKLALLLTVGALAAPVAARADLVGLTLEVWGGWKRYDTNLKTNLTNAPDDDVLKGSFNAVGADAVLKLGFLELGALYEGGLDYKSTKTATLAPMAGIGFDLTFLRIELLGEIGGQRYYDIAGSTQSTWRPYLGVRPGVSLRLDVLGPVRLVLGAWGFARWDLSKTTVVVPGQSNGPSTSYEVGGNTIGLVGRVGLEI
jgi:hypothetical protein